MSPEPAEPTRPTVVKVLLTGGPGAGKSSALATLRDRISKRGFQVVVVPENATALLDNSGGYEGTWHGTKMHVRLQQLFLKFQLEQEEVYRQFSELRPSKPHLILHDRGCLDGRLFCKPEEWEEVLEGVGVKEEDLLQRYDLVIHMTSVAQGMEKIYDYGPGSSNPARYHTPEQARQADDLAQEIYKSHPRVCVVPNFPDFAQKMDAVVRCVTKTVQVDGLSGPRDREEVAFKAGMEEYSQWPVECELYDVLVKYLNPEYTESVRRRQLVRPDGECITGAVASLQTDPVMYELRQEKQLGGKSVPTRKMLTEPEYALLYQQDHGHCTEVRKRAVCFTWQNTYYEVVTYHSKDESVHTSRCGVTKVVLDRPQGAERPPWLQVAPSKVRQLFRNDTAEAAQSFSRGGGKPVLSTKAAAEATTAATAGAAAAAAPTRGLKRHIEVTAGEVAQSVAKALASSSPGCSPTKMPNLHGA